MVQNSGNNLLVSKDIVDICFQPIKENSLKEQPVVSQNTRTLREHTHTRNGKKREILCTVHLSLMFDELGLTIIKTSSTATQI